MSGNGVPSRRPSIVDVILPRNEVHLFGGPSGAGKTRYLFQMLMDWQQGKDVLGFRSNPCDWVYVAGDRLIESVRETLGNIGVNLDEINHIPAWDRGMKMADILDNIDRSRCQLAVWEAFGSMVDPPANGRQVKEFLERIYRELCRRGITVIGIVESPKMKPYEMYPNPRQRISGAASWAHFSDCIMLIEPEAKADPSYRVLHVCPRNAMYMKRELAFDTHGRLVELEEDEAKLLRDVRKSLKKSVND